jgi:hypothetical protein
VRYVVPPGLARGVKLAIVMELCHLGSLFSMIGQVSLFVVFIEASLMCLAV